MNNAKETNQVPNSPPYGVESLETFWQDGDFTVTRWRLSRKPLSYNVERRAHFGDFTGTRRGLPKLADRSPRIISAILGSPEILATSLMNVLKRDERGDGLDYSSFSKRNPSRSYRLRVSSNVIDDLTPEECLDLVLKVIWGDLESTPSTSSASEIITKGKSDD